MSTPPTPVAPVIHRVTLCFVTPDSVPLRSKADHESDKTPGTLTALTPVELKNNVAMGLENWFATKVVDPGATVTHVEITFVVDCGGPGGRCRVGCSRMSAEDDDSSRYTLNHFQVKHADGKRHVVTFVVRRSDLSLRALSPACMHPENEWCYAYSVGGTKKEVDRQYDPNAGTSKSRSRYLWYTLFNDAANTPQEITPEKVAKLFTFYNERVLEVPRCRGEENMCCTLGYSYMGCISLALSSCFGYCFVPACLRNACICGVGTSPRMDMKPRSWICSEFVMAGLMVAGIVGPEHTQSACWYTPQRILELAIVKKWPLDEQSAQWQPPPEPTTQPAHRRSSRILPTRPKVIERPPSPSELELPSSRFGTPDDDDDLDDDDDFDAGDLDSPHLGTVYAPVRVKAQATTRLSSSTSL